MVAPPDSLGRACEKTWLSGESPGRTDEAETGDGLSLVSAIIFQEDNTLAERTT
jgi:hypothetical protein